MAHAGRQEEPVDAYRLHSLPLWENRIETVTLQASPENRHRILLVGAGETEYVLNNSTAPTIRSFSPTGRGSAMGIGLDGKLGRFPCAANVGRY